MRVSRSAYWAWAAGKTHQESLRRKQLRQRVKDCFERHRRRYGTKRIKAELASEGFRAGRGQISQLMKA
jgi:putative transposase